MRATSIALVTALLLLGAGCATPSNRLEANKNLVRQFVAAGNAANWDALSAIVAPDFSRHSAATAGPAVTSRDQFVELQKSFLATFPDQQVTVEQIVAEGDRVAVLATYSGTQRGPMDPFPATGKHVSAPFLALFRIDSGRIAELWVEWDNFAMLKQLGLFPPPPSS